MKSSGRFTGLFIVLLFAAFFYHWVTGRKSAVPEVHPGGRPSLGELAWMSGYWTGETDGERSEELWTQPRGGVMLGLHRTLRSGGTFFEHLRIEEGPEGIVCVVRPQDGPPAAFALKERGTGSVVFENPAHDYPKVIRYRLEGRRLYARIEGADPATDAVEWIWERTEFDR